MNAKQPLILMLALVFAVTVAASNILGQSLPKDLSGTTWHVKGSTGAQVTLRFKAGKKAQLSYDDKEGAIDWTGTFVQTDGKFTASFTEFEIDSMYESEKGKGNCSLEGKYYLSEDKKPVMMFSSMRGCKEVFQSLPAVMLLYLVN